MAIKHKSKSSSTSSRKAASKRAVQRRKPSKAPRRVLGLRWHHFSALSLVLIGLVWASSIVASQPPLKSSAATSCSVSSTLVNSCRPWLGAASSNYGVTGFANDMANHESRIGRQLDVVHDYRTPGQTLSTDDVTLASRANTYLMLNWKPAYTWADAGGGNATTNSQIDSMAASIKNLGSKKIFLTIFHEPENDVSQGGSPTCGSSITYKGTAGSTADYVNMWHNVRSRFDADGVTNVVWTMNYMGYSTWDCMVNDLWPGNSYVDWVVWDPYISDGSNFNSTISRFYNVLTSKSNGTDDYLSKTWGINEWGDWNSSQNAVYTDYGQAKTALDNNTYPKIKLWDDYDATGTKDARVGYSLSGTVDSTEQADYNNFADDPLFTDAHYTAPSPPPTPPASPPPSSPAPTPPPSTTGTTTTGTVSTGDASDTDSTSTVISVASSSSTPVAVKGTLVIASTESGASVAVSVDGKTQDSNAINTTKLTNGTHVLTITEAGKTVQQKIVVHNPWPTAFRNEIQAHPVAYTTGGSTSLLVILGVLWFGRRWIRSLIWRLHRKNLVHFGLGRIIKPTSRR